MLNVKGQGHATQSLVDLVSRSRSHEGYSDGSSGNILVAKSVTVELSLIDRCK